MNFKELHAERTADLNNDRIGRVHSLAKTIEGLIDNSGAFRNCLSCAYWENAKTTPDANGPPHPEGCGKYFQTPPAAVIVTGCNDHTDLIPF